MKLPLSTLIVAILLVCSLCYPKRIIKTVAGVPFFDAKINQAIRKINAEGKITTVAGGNGAGKLGDGKLAVQAQLHKPTCAFVANEELYICDMGNSAIRKVLQNGTITTVVGTLGGAGFDGDGGDARSLCCR